MRFDARNVTDAATLEADVCIVGAGPAGLSLAAELLGGPASIVVVESGGMQAVPDAQSLNDAVVEDGAYGAFARGRHRQVGGTAQLWNTPVAGLPGAKYVPLAAVDFRGVNGRPPWPLDHAELEPYYRRAHAVARLGRYEYRGAAWALPASPVPADHPLFDSRVFHFGPAARFCAELPGQIAQAANATLCHGATAVAWQWRGQAVHAVQAVTAGGGRLLIHARRLVLAAGGVENARMLLVEQAAGRFRDASGWLGRGLMEHPRDFSLRLARGVASERLEFLDARRIDGATVCGRIALRDEAIAREDLPNASVTLLPAGRRRRPFHWRLESLARRRLGLDLQWPPGFGWSRLPRTARRFDGFQVLVNLEELPHADNRLTLDGSRDRTGVPRVRLSRHWHAQDAARLERLRTALARGLREIGIGPLVVGPHVAPDPNSFHFMGTTRMGAGADSAVTDGQGRVHGTENVFVTGSSLFPAGGFANATLTSIALSLRLADWLRTHPA